jgi:hypothetical protein
MATNEPLSDVRASVPDSEPLTEPRTSESGSLFAGSD